MRLRLFPDASEFSGGRLFALDLMRGMGLFVLFGNCSLAAWMLHTNPLSSGLNGIARQLVVGVPKLVGTSAYFNVYVSFVQSVLLVLAVAYWYRFKKARA